MITIIFIMIMIVSADKAHRYLGRMLNLGGECRSEFEMQNRRKQVWGAFHKHRKNLLNHNLSLTQRLKLFNVCCTSSALFGVGVLPMTTKQRGTLMIIQRKMLRSIVGWRRIADEDWEVTMRRMKRRVELAMLQY